MGDKFKLVLKIEERFNAGNAQRKVFGKIKGRPNKNIEVIHHSGVKGMKWGVRNGPPYPIKNKGKVAKAQSTLKNADGKDIISVNHVELTGKPNSITQIQRKNGGIDRNYYDSSGRQIKQISNDLTVEKAYEYLKTLPEFEGAEDILEEKHNLS